MPATVWVVEDEQPLSLLLRYNLTSAGYQVETIDNGEDANLRLKEAVPDLLILDWMLPELSGIEILRRLRTRSDTKNLPVIMLTAKTEERDRLQGFQVGADDYVTKPFSTAELLERVKNLLRRMRPNVIADVLEVGDIKLNRVTRRVFRNGRERQLSDRAFQILECLMEKPGRVFSREELLNAIWQTDNLNINERTVDQQIVRLNRALGYGSIRTVRGRGYSFNEYYGKQE